jgi:hypothetical protein
MKTLRAIVILILFVTYGVGARAQDHLEPEEGSLSERDWHRDYVNKLSQVLLKDAPDYYVARMVCLPSFEPEWVVTIDRECEGGFEDDHPHSYFVECAKAKKQIWNQKSIEKIEVSRVKAPLDRKTAEAVFEVWRRMLHATRYPPEGAGLGTDGEVYHFSRQLPLFDKGRPDPRAGFEHGKIWSPDEDSPTGELVAIGEILKKYALARPEDRDKIQAEIRNKAEQLKAKLDRLSSPK